MFTRCAIRTSPITGTNSIFGNRSSNSSRMLCIGVSAESNRISCFTPNVASCLQSSLPIEPAAPVTRIVLSLKLAIISFMFILISSRPSRSSIRISRILARNSLSPLTSSTGGAINTFILFFSQ